MSRPLALGDICEIAGVIVGENDDGSYGPDVVGFVLARDDDGAHFNVRKGDAHQPAEWLAERT